MDGGLGQLHAVHEALKNYDLSGITVIAISKGPERNAGKEFYHIIGKESFSLPFQSPIAFYMQNLRDEAHRFAIGTHRKKRAKSMKLKESAQSVKRLCLIFSVRLSKLSLPECKI